MESIKIIDGDGIKPTPMVRRKNVVKIDDKIHYQPASLLPVCGAYSNDRAAIATTTNIELVTCHDCLIFVAKALESKGLIKPN